VEKV
jgi:hypothetical protein